MEIDAALWRAGQCQQVSTTGGRRERAVEIGRSREASEHHGRVGNQRAPTVGQVNGGAGRHVVATTTSGEYGCGRN